MRWLAVLLLTAGCSSKSDDATSSSNTTTVAASDRGVDVAAPTVSGPVEGGKYGLPFNAMPVRLGDEYGYEEQEYFIEGTATAYQPAGDFTADGKWDVTATTTAPYKTRMIVRRPTDPSKFNGTVVVEWLNVSVAFDSDPDFGFARQALMRDGYAYVGVSVQPNGIVGGGPKIDIPGVDLPPLKEWDPERYGTLTHPGDDYTYDMFSQAGQAVRRPNGVNPFDGLDVQRLMAAGESQSAGRMTTYVNAIQPITDMFDGFLIHSRGGTGAALTSAGGRMPQNAHIRSDITEPVLQVETETDLLGLGFYGARQPDADLLRTWELAGTAHADQSTVDYGVESGRQWDTTTQIDFTDLCGQLNTGPQRFLVRRAIVALNTWIVDGTPPPNAQVIEVENGVIVRDDHGNAVGGIRTPAVDAPISTLTGEPDEGESVICTLFGGTTPFDAAQLVSAVPDAPGLRGQGDRRRGRRGRRRFPVAGRPGRDGRRRRGRRSAVLIGRGLIRARPRTTPGGQPRRGRGRHDSGRSGRHRCTPACT